MIKHLVALLFSALLFQGCSHLKQVQSHAVQKHLKTPNPQTISKSIKKTSPLKKLQHKKNISHSRTVSKVDHLKKVRHNSLIKNHTLVKKNKRIKNAKQTQKLKKIKKIKKVKSIQKIKRSKKNRATLEKNRQLQKTKPYTGVQKSKQIEKLKKVKKIKKVQQTKQTKPVKRVKELHKNQQVNKDQTLEKVDKKPKTIISKPLKKIKKASLPLIVMAKSEMIKPNERELIYIKHKNLVDLQEALEISPVKTKEVSSIGQALRYQSFSTDATLIYLMDIKKFKEIKNIVSIGQHFARKSFWFITYTKAKEVELFKTSDFNGLKTNLIFIPSEDFKTIIGNLKEQSTLKQVLQSRCFDLSECRSFSLGNAYLIY